MPVGVPEPVPPSLTALVDTLLPGVTDVASRGHPYPAASAVDVDQEIATLVAGLPRAHREEFHQLLRAIDSPFMNLLLTGRATRFTRLSPARRESYLRGWSTSRLAAKRRGFQAAKRLAAWFYFSAPVSVNGHPLWERIHYVPPPLPQGVPDPLAGLSPVVPASDTEVSADVCVVGSGAGGSVIAARAASAGHRVVVLEAGPWVVDLEYPRTERDGFDALYYGRGIVPTKDSAFAILAGESAGGSTEINWMTCLPPRPEARTEWNDDAGVAGPDDVEFARALDAVSARLRVSRTTSDVNPPNEVLRRGSVALGYREGIDWEVIARNGVGCEQRCGSCIFGCPYAARQSARTTFLADALRAGARLYCRTRADRVEVDGGRARGVVAVYRANGVARTVHVRARAVVAAGGALQTPALLRRSGVAFPGVGLGLRLDPTTAMVGEFPTPMRTWEGPHQTIAVRRFQTIDPGAHGPWIEASPVHPGLAALATPWAGAADFLRLLERLEYVATPIVLVRDTGEGQVSVDGDGRPVIDYRLTAADREHLVRGLAETARILAAAGATRLLSLATPYLEVGDGTRALTPAELDRFLAGVDRAGIREHSAGLFSAHPMGSARLGRDPRRSAARPTGEVHGVDGLWIGDGSLVPSAPGSNPMMSILALAYRTADHLISSLGGAVPRAAAGQG